jgi:hypothetical protein
MICWLCVRAVGQAPIYQEMFRLRGMDYPNETVQRTRYFGVLTVDIVYDRLAPGVLEELKKAHPKALPRPWKCVNRNDEAANQGNPDAG